MCYAVFSIEDLLDLEHYKYIIVNLAVFNKYIEKCNREFYSTFKKYKYNHPALTFEVYPL